MKPYKEWTDEEIILDAKKYPNRTRWCWYSPSPYYISKKRGIFDVCVEHMPEPTNRPRSIRNLDTGIIYRSCRDASVATGIPLASIRCAVNGEMTKAGGYRWEYVQT